MNANAPMPSRTSAHGSPGVTTGVPVVRVIVMVVVIDLLNRRIALGQRR
jgi:hypothetical protein